mgnify:CR=1 FL=1
MLKKNITFLEVQEEFEKNLILKQYPHAKIYPQTLQKLIENNQIDEIKDTQILSTFIYSKLNEENISKLKHLEFLITRSTGKNHINIEYCTKEKCIQVANVSKYGEHTVAEFTFALMLTISRKIIPAVSKVKRGDFNFSNLQGFDICGKTVGVIGFGNIGQKFAKMCKGFDTTVLAYDAFPGKVQKEAEELGVKLVNLDKLFNKSDVISLHVPLLPQTHHIISYDAIGKMKQGVVIINTSRGELIDTKAILEGLENNKIGAVGLDVIEKECMMKDEQDIINKNLGQQSFDNYKSLLENHVLINHPNVFITPHNAFNTTDAIKRIYSSTFQQIEEFVQTK